MKPSKKFAVVTGASTGIGREVSVELGRKGYWVGLVARRREKLEETKKLIEEAGGQAEVFVADISDVAQINSLIQSIKAKTDRIDLIANIAGIWHGTGEVYAGKDYEDFEQKVILDTMTVGLTAPVLIVHGLLPLMESGSSIVNLSGTFENGAKGWLPYFVSKRAIEDLTVGLAEELKDKGISVNCVSPSDTATEEYIKYFPEDAKDANTPVQVAKLIVEVADKAETGKFWVIKRGERKEGFHI